MVTAHVLQTCHFWSFGVVYCCGSGQFAYQISDICPIGSGRTVGAGVPAYHMTPSYPGNQTEIYTTTPSVARHAEANHSWGTCSNSSFRNLPDAHRARELNQPPYPPRELNQPPSHAKASVQASILLHARNASPPILHHRAR
jgi:hypothetical protein